MNDSSPLRSPVCRIIQLTLTPLILLALCIVARAGGAFVVTNASSVGVGTLFEAINLANSTPGIDTIVFNIPGAGPHTIQRTAAFPNITEGVSILGFSQPGSQINTLTNDNNAVLKIELDGSLAGNNTVGLVIDAPGVVISGIAINNYDDTAIFISPNGTGSIIKGCFLGPDVDGTTLLGNGGQGLDIEADDCLIGGVDPGDMNIIAGNTEDGVFIAEPNTGNRITRNSIHSNGNGDPNALGIDNFLDGASGVNPNDHGACDVDTGGNELQNFPVLTIATSDGVNTMIDGWLQTNPNFTYTVEFFANTVCDDSNHGEGEIYLGSTTVVIGGSCSNSFSAVLPVAVADGMFITATSTHQIKNNTSEFSACITAQATVSSVVCSIVPLVSTNDVDDDHVVTCTVTTNGTAATGVTVNFFVSAGPNAGDSGSDGTDVNGDAVFQYTGDGGVGTDTIMATGLVNGVAFSCSASKLWVGQAPDLVVSKTDSPDPVEFGSNLTYTITIANVGTLAASNVAVTDALPASVTFVSATPSQGVCTQIAGVVTCDLGALGITQTATVHIVGVPATVGTINNTASAIAPEGDVDTLNNSATEFTTVNPPLANFSLSINGLDIVCSNNNRSGITCVINGTVVMFNRSLPVFPGSLTVLGEGGGDEEIGTLDVSLTSDCKGEAPEAKCKLRGTIEVLELDLTDVDSTGISLFLSDDDVFDTNDVLLTKKEISLETLAKANDKNKPAKLKAKIPKGADVSGKFILFVVNAGGDVPETDDSDNTAAFGPIP